MTNTTELIASDVGVGQAHRYNAVLQTHNQDWLDRFTNTHSRLNITSVSPGSMLTKTAGLFGKRTGQGRAGPGRAWERAGASSVASLWGRKGLSNRIVLASTGKIGFHNNIIK